MIGDEETETPAEDEAGADVEAAPEGEAVAEGDAATDGEVGAEQPAAEASAGGEGDPAELEADAGSAEGEAVAEGDVSAEPPIDDKSDPLAYSAADRIDTSKFPDVPALEKFIDYYNDILLITESLRLKAIDQGINIAYQKVWTQDSNAIVMLLVHQRRKLKQLKKESGEVT